MRELKFFANRAAMEDFKAKMLDRVGLWAEYPKMKTREDLSTRQHPIVLDLDWGGREEVASGDINA